MKVYLDVPQIISDCLDKRATEGLNFQQCAKAIGTADENFDALLNYKKPTPFVIIRVCKWLGVKIDKYATPELEKNKSEVR